MRGEFEAGAEMEDTVLVALEQGLQGGAVTAAAPASAPAAARACHMSHGEVGPGDVAERGLGFVAERGAASSQLRLEGRGGVAAQVAPREQAWEDNGPGGWQGL